MSIEVIHRGESYVVVNKPPGLLSVPGRGAETDPAKADCVRSRVHELFPQAAGPMTVHRLDMDTSGLILVGLNKHGQRHLSMQFEARTVSKLYHALLVGHHEHMPEGGKLTIDFPIMVDWPNRPLKKFDFLDGKHSTTECTVIARETYTRDDANSGGAQADQSEPLPVTRVHFKPITGRGHQLRVHAAFDRTLIDELTDTDHEGGLGTPIVGDDLYGNGIAEAPRLMLHAAELAFDDPDTGKRIELSCPPAF